jgi:hypothetical protein
MTFRALTFLAALGLGCAMPALPELDASHPASADAPEAPAAQPSTTLSVQSTPHDEVQDPMNAAPSGVSAHGGHHGHH